MDLDTPIYVLWAPDTNWGDAPLAFCLSEEEAQAKRGGSGGGTIERIALRDWLLTDDEIVDMDEQAVMAYLNGEGGE